MDAHGHMTRRDVLKRGGALVAAVQATETAAGANGINVAFDASVVTEVRKLIADFPEIVAQVEAAFAKSS